MTKTKIFKNKVRTFQVIGALAVCAALLGAFIYCYMTYGKELTQIFSDPQSFRAFFARFKGYDMPVFVAIRAFQTVIKIIPAEPLEIGSGSLYGTWGGLLLCWIGSMLGSFVIIVLTKIFGRRLVNAFVPIEKIDSMKFLNDDKRVYQILFFIYLIPGTPKDILTYAAGITKLNMFKFLLITGIARIPSIVTSTWCGDQLINKNYTMAAAIFIATAVLSVICSFIYKKFSDAHDKKAALNKDNIGEDADA